MDTRCFLEAAQESSSSLPIVGFVYLTSGDVLVEVENTSYLIGAGHLLLIPENVAFAIHHYSDAVGYTGGFQPSFFGDAKSLQFLREPLQQAFWFDEGAFMGELFNMLALRFERGDMAFIEKGLELLLTRVRALPSLHLPPPVSGFLDRLFSDGRSLLTASAYAAEMNLSINYLNRVVKRSTGRPLGFWIDTARLNRAKRMLKDSSLPMIDIAAAAGFFDQAYFARFFKKHTGMTPSAFRVAMHG